MKMEIKKEIKSRIAIFISDKKILKQRLYNKRQRRTQQFFSSDELPPKWNNSKRHRQFYVYCSIINNSQVIEVT